MDLQTHWEREAEAWARWARTPEHDIYWSFSGPRFLELVPPPGRRTLDLGCGEGRLARDLAVLGHRVVGVDASPTLLRLAAEADQEGDYVRADAAALPFEDASFDLAVAFNSLMDMDDLDAALREAGRVVEPGGRLCICIIHPLNSAAIDLRSHDPALRVEDYLTTREYVDELERDGLSMRFRSMHRPLEQYVAALAAAGFLIETVREPRLDPQGDDAPTLWERVPMFLLLRAVRVGRD